MQREKIKPVAIAIVELHESESIGQAVSQSVEILFNIFFCKKIVATF